MDLYCYGSSGSSICIYTGNQRAAHDGFMCYGLCICDRRAMVPLCKNEGKILSGHGTGYTGSRNFCISSVYDGALEMEEKLVLKNNLKQIRTEKHLSQSQLAEMVGVSRNTISSIETGQFNPTAKLALILCIALEKKFEELFYFD